MSRREPAQWQVSPHVGTTRSGQQALLLDIAKGVVCKLNQAGSLVWLAISSSPGRNTADGVITVLQRHYPNIPHTRLEMDIIDFLEKLEQMRLIQRLP